MLSDNSVQVQELLDTLDRRRVSVLFQPVMNLANGKIFGYEGQLRGPSDSLLHSPLMLYRLAKQVGKLLELENLCAEVQASGFAELKLQGSLFMKLNGEAFLENDFAEARFPQSIEKVGIDAQRVIVTLYSLGSGMCDYPALRRVIKQFSQLGYKVGLEDEGEYFSMLPGQSEDFPFCIKINRHLIHDIDKEPIKIRLVKSLLGLAGKAGITTIAEGIETRGEFLLAREAGITLGQGSFIAEPNKNPVRTTPREIKTLLSDNSLLDGNQEQNGVEAILERTPSFSLENNNEQVFQLFEKNPQILVVAVTNRNVPVGLINRNVFINRYARPYQRELYGKKSCSTFMDPEPLIVDRNIAIQDLSRLLSKNQRHLSLGFIFTENGYYIGVGTSQNLIHEITEMQIQSARYANPLTGLPGNAPIDEHIDALLADKEQFCVCYFDLDNFKPFNDVYGFSMGDAMIQMTAKIISEESNAEVDFVGHIGGDDFIVLFCSADWEARCHAILQRFESEVKSFFSSQDVERGGYVTENRRGEKEFHNLSSLSIGAVPVKPDVFKSHREVAVVAAESKKMAKRMHGNSLFINQRDYSMPAAARQNNS